MYENFVTCNNLSFWKFAARTKLLVYKNFSQWNLYIHCMLSKHKSVLWWKLYQIPFILTPRTKLFVFLLPGYLALWWLLTHHLFINLHMQRLEEPFKRVPILSLHIYTSSCFLYLEYDVAKRAMKGASLQIMSKFNGAPTLEWLNQVSCLVRKVIKALNYSKFIIKKNCILRLLLKWFLVMWSQGAWFNPGS